MRARAFFRAYYQAVHEAYRSHLSQRGFALRKERFGVLAAESAACRILFHPETFIPCVQRTSPDFQQASPAVDLTIALEACGRQDHLEPQQIQAAEHVKSEVNRIACLIVEKCKPLLDGDEAAWSCVCEVARGKEDEALAQWGEVGLNLKEDGEWRELPELESVSVKGSNRLATTLIAALLLVLPAGYIIFLIIMYGILLLGEWDADGIFVALGLTAFGVPAAVLCIWIVRRVVRSQYSWKTSTEGLTVGGFRKKQLVRWEDVESAAIVPNFGYELRTSQGSLRLGKEALCHSRLEASVWQHLNRRGKTDAIALSPFAMSLWAEISDENVKEIHWENPAAPHASQVLLKLVAWEVLIWGITLRFGLDPIPVAAVFAYWPVVMAVASVIVIKRIAADTDGIEAVTALGTLRVPWDRVRSVRFLNSAFGQPASLLLRTRLLGFVRIPWIPQHPNSTRVMLAILRRLRQEDRFRLLSFPTVLLLAAHGSGHLEPQ